jgi:hypothetical protein
LFFTKLLSSCNELFFFFLVKRLEGKNRTEEDVRQYIYGENETKDDSSDDRHVNIIEQEIREQQLREAALRQEGTLMKDEVDFSEDSGCAEFQEFDPTAPVKLPVVATPVVVPAPRPVSPVVVDDVESVALTPTVDGELTPPATFFDPCQYSTEAKIALEIRELKEREEELRRMRSRFQSGGMHSQDNLNSLPTSSTDEGNCSEYGSGEDASNKEVASIEGGGSSRSVLHLFLTFLYDNILLVHE